MTQFQTGDLVVLKSGSMRMCVEEVSEGRVDCVWCHEGRIGRDSFAPALLKSWEHREDDRAGSHRGGAKDRETGGPRVNGRGGEGRAHRGGEGGDDRPRKTGWDGKPRDKKHFRKDG